MYTSVYICIKIKLKTSAVHSVLNPLTLRFVRKTFYTLFDSNVYKQNKLYFHLRRNIIETMTHCLYNSNFKETCIVYLSIVITPETTIQYPCKAMSIRLQCMQLVHNPPLLPVVDQDVRITPRIHSFRNNKTNHYWPAEDQLFFRVLLSCISVLHILPMENQE